MHPALMILVALVLGYLLFGYVFSWSILLLFKLLDLIGPAGGIIFFGICLAAILGMIWYGFKKR